MVERNDSVSPAVSADRRETGGQSATLALCRQLPPTPTEVFRDLGMSMNAICDYFRRFPDLQRT